MRALMVGLLLLSTPAWADDAADLRGAIQGWARAWSAGVVGDVPLSVRAEGTGFVLEVPFGGKLPDEGLAISQGKLTTRVHALDAGRWAIDEVAIPPQVSLDTTVGAKVRTVLSLGGQKTEGVFDPSLATESRMDTRLDDYVVAVTGAEGASSTKMAHLTSHSLWTPVGTSRVTMTNETEIQSYAQHTAASAAKGKAAAVPPTDVTVQRIRMRTAVDGVSFAQLGSAVRKLFTLLNDGPPKPGAKGAAAKMTKAQLALAHDALFALVAAGGNMEGQQDWDGVTFQAGGQTGSLKHVGMGISLRAPEGRVALKLPMVVEGFSAPALGDQAVQAVLPQSLRLTPRLSGLSKQALLELVDRVMRQQTPPDMSAEFASLLEGSDLVVGLDDLAFDLGPMKVTGKGQLDVAATDDISGAAELRATGLDALIKRAGGVPALKQAVPVLIFLKGIAEADGAASVWKITYADGGVAVNGTSLADLGLPGQ